MFGEENVKVVFCNKWSHFDFELARYENSDLIKMRRIQTKTESCITVIIGRAEYIEDRRLKMVVELAKLDIDRIRLTRSLVISKTVEREYCD